MKRIISILLFATVATNASAQSGVYTITGKIDGAERVEFFLKKSGAGEIININSAVVKNGTFLMKGGSVEYPERVKLTTSDNKYQLTFYLENRDISITGKLTSLSAANVEGSKTQDDYNALNQSMLPVISCYTSKVQEFKTADKS